MHKTMLLAFAGAIAANSGAIAATPPGVTMSADQITVHVHHSVGSYTPPLAHKSKIPAIYENFANLYPKGVYNASTGYSLSGPNTIHGQYWLAGAFTPTVSATVREVDVAAGFINGQKNSVLIGLYADAAGIPGAELWSRKAALPSFGDCCALVALADKAAVKVIAGTQYWLAITTLPNATDTSAAWNQTVLDQVDPGVNARNTGTGWQAGATTPNLAFGVYGK